MKSSETTRNHQSIVRVLALAAMVFALSTACSSGRSEPESKAGTPAKMDSAVALTEQTEKETDMSDDSAQVEEEAKEEKTAVKYEYPIRDKKNHIVKLETNYGDLVLELYRDVAPNHADSFLARVEDSFYVGTVFHRVMKGFMIQGGGFTELGQSLPKEPGYNLNAEFSKLPHLRGTFSMARSPAGPNTASSQFFVCHGDPSFLDGQYTVFGHLLKGYEVLDSIATMAVTPDARGEKSVPTQTVRVSKATRIK